MNISEVALASGLTAKAIRYYEQIGLVAPPRRAENGYRDYAADDLRQLKFVQQARQFGFSLDECRQLLALYRDPLRESAQVHVLVNNKLEEVAQRMRELRQMSALLKDLIDRCPNDNEPACTIIDSLAGEAAKPQTPASRAVAGRSATAAATVNRASRVGE